MQHLSLRVLFQLLVLFGFFEIQVHAEEWELKQIWTIENQFKMPESAAYDPTRKVVYVSNVNHYAKESNGFISRVSEDGSDLELKWLTGLHSPTGLAVRGNILYAVDYDALVIISLETSSILKRVPAEDAVNTPVLNDVAVATNGDVYVSGSNSRNIYKLHEEKLTTWNHDTELLKHANGLLVDGEHLLHGGASFTAFEITNKRPDALLSNMGQDLVEIDGISRLIENSFIVSLIDDDRLWLLKKGAPPRPLSQKTVKGIDMQFVAENNVLFIPRVGNTLSAYQVLQTQ